jgi:hypothetical protein
MSSSNTLANRRLAHRTELPMALGCNPCPERGLCGGLKIDEVFFDCSSLCRCSKEEKRSCPHVCPAKPQEFVKRLQEVGGFGFETVGSAPVVPVPVLPRVVPWIDGRGCLAGGISLPMAAVPLRRLFSHKTGRVLALDSNQLAARFAVTPETPLLVTGVSFEQPIEDYWGMARATGFLDDLASLSPALVTTPNFSLFSDKPREDNLYNMKRIAICWHELAVRKIPTALHLNARTDRDWARWREFLEAHPEILSVAFEFGTGAAARARAQWHLHHLVAVADGAKRALTLVVRGGRTFLNELRAHFSQVAFIATDPLMRARKRRLLIPGVCGMRLRRLGYRRGAKVVRLFLRNLAAYTQVYG